MSQTDKIRPGVDANIVEANVVRGHDAILTGNVPENLQIAASRNDVDDVVGIVTIWNRTDSTTEQVLDLRSGLVFGTAERAQMFVGAIDPTGILTATAGSLYVATTPPKLYQNQDGATDWKVISDDLGGETLAETLVLGNTTDNTPIIVSDQPLAGIRGEDQSGGTGGGDLKLRGGNESGIAGNGGNVEVSTGTTVGGNSGSIVGSTATVTTGGASGSIQWVTGSTTGGGGTGTITIRTGTTDVAATGALQLGSGNATGSGGTGGLVNMKAGDGPSDGVGGELRVLAGNTFPIVIPSAPQPPGTGGKVLVYGGASSGTINGGNVVIAGGAGGSGGGDGGNVLLGGGAGGGGGSEGQVYATSIFSAENIKRGTSDPNGSVSGNEGDIYQRTAGGVGELYLNTNGTVNGWIKLGAAGDFFNSLVKTQFGSVHASMATNQINSFGFFDDSTLSTAGAPSILRVADEGGPNLSWTVNNADSVGVQVLVGGGAGSLTREQKFVIGFKFSVSSLDTGYNSFLGLSNQNLSTMLTNSPLGDWMGLQKLDGTTNYRFATRGNTGIYNAGNVTFALDEVHYFIIDTTVSNAITFLLLDSTLNLIQTATISPVSDNTSPALTEAQRPICGIKGTDAVLKTFDFYHFTAVVNGDLNLGGGGGGGSTPTLETVLTSGDFTGSNYIILTDWDATWGGIIRGEADPPLNIPDGGRVTLAGGATTDLLGTGGHVYVFSGNPAIASANKSGDISLTSGSVLDALNTGGTGDAVVSSGVTTGSGPSGDLWLLTGATVTGTSGTVRLQSNFSTGGNTGNVEIRSGAAGLTAGDITLTSGNSTSGQGGGIALQCGNGGGAAGQGGDILMITGVPDPGFNLIGGSVGILCTQGAGSGDGGSFAAAAGNGGPGGGNGGTIGFTAGNGVAGVSTGGSIVLNPGSGFGGGADGAVLVNGKLTVTGLIDPTGMVLVNQAAIPGGTPAAGSSTLWVRTSDNSLMLTDSGGSDHPVSGSAIETKDEGGTLTTLTQSYDFVGAGVTASAIGNNVTVTIPGGGGAADLGTVLGNGNQTNAHNIELTSGDAVIGENNPGGDGGNVNFLTGNSTNAGSRSGHFYAAINTPGAGGNAGYFYFKGNLGGDNAAGNAGTGSDFLVETKDGGTATAGGFDGGRGGSVVFDLGDGGGGDGAGLGGGGGDMAFQLGDGGTGGTGGAGGDFVVAAGVGGAGATTCGVGGRIRLVAGAGSGSAVTAGSNAGSLELYTDLGGTTTNAGSDGGDGGPWNVQLGNGGGAAGAGGGGDGGYIAFQSGAGGSTGSGVAGSGGLCSITLGQGADATGGTGGLGGLFDLTAGDGGNEISAGGGGAGGGMTITLGDGGQGVGGGNTGGAAGDFIVTAGDGGVGTGGAAGLIGGFISLTAGNGGTGAPGGGGGTVTIIAGAAASGGQDGNVVLATRAPNPGPFFGVGGEVLLLTSNAAAGGVGSYIRMLPGSGTTGGSGTLHGGDSATGNGGNVTLQAGATTLAGASSGGDAHVIAGDASNVAGSGGNIYLTPGPASGGGLPGVISFDGGVDPGGPASGPLVGHQRSCAASVGAVPGFGGMIDPTLLPPGSYPTSFVVLFNVPFAAAPSNIQVTLASFAAIPGAPAAGTVAVVHSVTNASFEIGFDAAGPQPNMGIYWEAWL